MRPTLTLAVALLAAPIFAADGSLQVHPLESPAGPGSGMPFLASLEGVAYLSWWEESDAGRHRLRLSRWSNGDWTPAGTIAEGEEFFVNWADFPSLLPLPDGSLAAQWLVKSGDSAYAYDVVVAHSTDGGTRWSEPVRPHRDGTLTEHGFASMVGLGPGRFGILWLDGRSFQADKASGAEPAEEMQLRFSVFKDGAFGEEMVVDSRVCDCCQTAMALIPGGLLAAYRDRSNGEVRDISYARYLDWKWSEPQTIHDDGWKISGCPVNGPAVAVDGKQVAVAWFTGAPQGRVLVSFSRDAGARFSSPFRLDAGKPEGRVDVEWLADGAAVVSWIEHEADAAVIRARTAHPERGPGPPVTVARTFSKRDSGFPRMARRDDGVMIAWTDPGEPDQVRVAELRPGSESTEASPGGGEAVEATVVGRLAPDFTGTTPAGDQISLRDLQGKVVLLNFWGTWCPPCRREIPGLIRLYEELRERDFEILAVNAGDRREIVAPFIAKQGISYPVLYDDGITRLYDVDAYPTTIVIDQTGKIRFITEGDQPDGLIALRQTIDSLLKGSDPGR